MPGRFEKKGNMNAYQELLTNISRLQLHLIIVYGALALEIVLLSFWMDQRMERRFDAIVSSMKEAEKKRIYDRHTNIFCRLMHALNKEGWVNVFQEASGTKGPHVSLGTYAPFRLSSDKLELRAGEILTVVINPNRTDFDSGQISASDNRATHIYGCAEDMRAFAKKVARFLENSYTVG